MEVNPTNSTPQVAQSTADFTFESVGSNDFQSTFTEGFKDSFFSSYSDTDITDKQLDTMFENLDNMAVTESERDNFSFDSVKNDAFDSAFETAFDMAKDKLPTDSATLKQKLKIGLKESFKDSFGTYTFGGMQFTKKEYTQFINGIIMAGLKDLRSAEESSRQRIRELRY